MKNAESFRGFNNDDGSVIDYFEQKEDRPPRYSREVMRWADGIDFERNGPKPFLPNLEDIYDSEMLELTTGLNTEEEANKIIDNNYEALVRNNRVIWETNEHIIDIADLDQSELEALYLDESTSESDKSIIACINLIRLGYEKMETSDDFSLMANVEKATEDMYGFNMVSARERLRMNNSHFRILTKKEREKVPAGSIEDIASAALESFVMNSNYSNNRIEEYDDYLYGIQLDCTKRTVVNEGGVKTIKKEVDLEEFQSRATESMAWALLDDDSEGRYYTEDEFLELQKRDAELRADYDSGRHFPNDYELHKKWVRVGVGEARRGINGMVNDDYWERYRKRIRRNNVEVFRYNKKLAEVEMKPLVDNIDIEKVDSINNDKTLDMRQKVELITAHMQEAFWVQHLDWNGRRRSIRVGWFRDRKSRKKVKDDKVPDCHGRWTDAYWLNSEGCIYYGYSWLQSKTKLPDRDIATIAHEMGHAKQDDYTHHVPIDYGGVPRNEKGRMYYKNDKAYIGDGAGYYWQIEEVESYMIGKLFLKKLKEYRFRKRGRELLKLFKSLF